MNVEQENLNKIADYYESKTNRIWDIIGKGHIHLGYWDQDNQDGSFASGTRKLTQVMIDKTVIQKDQVFCDFGCGIGMPAIALARTKGCRVNGVTLSPYQQEEAQKRAGQQGTDTLTRFMVANALDLSFEDNSHDGGWFFESIFHMGHEQALQEACRVLKPGSTLVIADVTDIGVFTQDQKETAKTALNATFITKQAYPGLLEKTGFELVELLDVTQKVMEPFESKLAQAVTADRTALLKIADQELLDRFHLLGREMKHTCGYVIVVARKPL